MFAHWKRGKGRERKRQSRELLGSWLWIENSCTYYYSVDAAILFCLLSQYQIVYWSELPTTTATTTTATAFHTKNATRQSNPNETRQLTGLSSVCLLFIVTHRNLSEVFNSLHGIYFNSTLNSLDIILTWLGIHFCQAFGWFFFSSFSSHTHHKRTHKWRTRVAAQQYVNKAHCVYKQALTNTSMCDTHPNTADLHWECAFNS